MSKDFSFKFPDEKIHVKKLQKILEELMEEMPVQIALQSELAKITRAKYLALIGQGFTKEEAIQLCR